MSNSIRSRFTSLGYYLIIQCYSCGQLLLANDGQKTKLCTYCNSRLNLSKVKVLVRDSSAEVTSRLVKILKKDQINVLSDNHE